MPLEDIVRAIDSLDGKICKCGHHRDIHTRVGGANCNKCNCKGFRPLNKKGK